MRRILILVENLPVPLDRRVWLEATTLQRAGYQVSVIAPAGRGWTAPYEELEGVHIYRFPEPPEARESAWAFGREWLITLWHMGKIGFRIRRERGFDVIQGCNPPDLLWIIAWIFRPFGVRYLFDHHDVCPELYQAKFNKQGVFWQILRGWEWVNFFTASVSIATNESFRARALARGLMAPEDVFVVRSAPKVETFLLDPDARPNDGTIRMGFVGVIGQQEGMDLLAEAADHLIRKLGHENVHFDIIGFGPSLQDVKQDVSARGLDAYFTFHGPQYADDLVALLNRVDIGVAPDPKNAMNDISTMNKIMEYMTLEKPVVLFDLKEGRASAGEAALYAEPNDPLDFAAKLAELIEAPEKRAEMGRIGRARVLERLSWAHSVPQLLAAYDRIFAKMGR